MKPHVIVIHGGMAFETEQEYLASLVPMEISLEPSVPGWKPNLVEALGAGVEVIRPTMPCKRWARYEGWKIWFEKYIPHLHDGVVLVGHSLGGLFLVKYLSENRMPVQIGALVLVAAVFAQEGERSVPTFNLSGDFELLTDQVSSITLYHSRDDQVVSYDDAGRFLQVLPGATLKTFEDRGHFNGERLPELEQQLRELTAQT